MLMMILTVMSLSWADVVNDFCFQIPGEKADTVKVIPREDSGSTLGSSPIKYQISTENQLAQGNENYNNFATKLTGGKTYYLSTYKRDGSYGRCTVRSENQIYSVAFRAKADKSEPIISETLCVRQSPFFSADTNYCATTHSKLCRSLDFNKSLDLSNLMIELSANVNNKLIEWDDSFLNSSSDTGPKSETIKIERQLSINKTAESIEHIFNPVGISTEETTKYLKNINSDTTAQKLYSFMKASCQRMNPRGTLIKSPAVPSKPRSFTLGINGG